MHYAPFQWCNQVWAWLSWHAGPCAPGRNTVQIPDEERTTSEPTIYSFWVASTHWERTAYRQQPAEHTDILTERFTAKYVRYTAGSDSDTQHITYSCRTQIFVTINLKKQTKDNKRVSGFSPHNNIIILSRRHVSATCPPSGHLHTAHNKVTCSAHNVYVLWDPIRLTNVLKHSFIH